MPQVNDVVRTRLCLQQRGGTYYLTFWWKLLQWHVSQPVDEFLFAVGLNWLAALDPWINTEYVVLGAAFDNLTTTEPHHFFQYSVSGLPKPENVAPVENTVWCTRFGIDAFGNSAKSRFPISNLSVDYRRGRLEGNGQNPQVHAFLTEQHTIISPLAPVWIGGFIHRLNGEFVQTTRTNINPVVKTMKARRPKNQSRIIDPLFVPP